MYTSSDVQRVFRQQQLTEIYWYNVLLTRLGRSVGVGVAILGLLLLLLRSLLRLLGGLFFLLLLLALRLVFTILVIIFTAALALFALAVDFHGILASRCNRGSGQDVGSRCGLRDRCGSAINVAPVKVLVLSVPLGRCLLIRSAKFLGSLVLSLLCDKVATYVESTSLLHLLLLGRNGTHAPPPGVEVALHNHTLDLGNDTVIA